MPASRSGRRCDRAWNTKANISIPPPEMHQAMIAPKPPVERANVAGRAKMPAPIIEPITRAVSALSDSFWSDVTFWLAAMSGSEGLCDLGAQVQGREAGPLAVRQPIDERCLPRERESASQV